MPTLIRAKSRGKFRPCRSDVPKRVVAHVPLDGYPTLSIIAAGDKIDGIKLASMPATQSVVRSGVGTAHHLRRFPVLLVCKGGNRRCPLEKRIAEMLEWVKQQFPGSKPAAHGDDSVRVILWADDHKKLRETIRNGWIIREV